jgi:hypothetical protein
MMILQYADVFLAEGPDPAVADKLQLFGQFVGSWDVAVTNHRPDGSSETIPAEWHFAWALGGRAIQDVWIAPSRAERVSGRDGEWGATLRFYDDSIDAWRSTWIGPRNRIVMPFLARSEGDQMFAARLRRTLPSRAARSATTSPTRPLGSGMRTPSSA